MVSFRFCFFQMRSWGTRVLVSQPKHRHLVKSTASPLDSRPPGCTLGAPGEELTVLGRPRGLHQGGLHPGFLGTACPLDVGHTGLCKRW